MDTPDWMQHAGLLAGLGPRALQGHASEAAPLPFRTCIEAGSGALVAVQAPGGRGLHLWTQAAGASSGVQQWTRWHDGQPVGRVLIGGPGWEPADWGWARPQRGLHRVLGAQAWLYRIDADDGAEPWFAYQLPRHADVAEVFARLDLANAWRTVAEVWAGVLGRALPPRSRPWSLALQGDGDGAPALRVASSLWALAPETPDKSDRLARVVDELGGDGCFAQALYKLLASDPVAASSQVVGAAIEIGLHADGALDRCNFVLRGPRPTHRRDAPPPPLH